MSVEFPTDVSSNLSTRKNLTRVTKEFVLHKDNDISSLLLYKVSDDRLSLCCVPCIVTTVYLLIKNMNIINSYIKSYISFLLIL